MANERHQSRDTDRAESRILPNAGHDKLEDRYCLRAVVHRHVRFWLLLSRMRIGLKYVPISPKKPVQKLVEPRDSLLELPASTAKDCITA